MEETRGEEREGRGEGRRGQKRPGGLLYLRIAQREQKTRLKRDKTTFVFLVGAHGTHK
jgi:hypothetical protein